MTKKSLILILFLLCFENSFSQNFQKIFFEINTKDKLWIISKPISSLKVKKVTKEVNSILIGKSNGKFLDQDLQGGQIDAFRHILLLYKLSSEIGIEKARRFGNIYESYNKKVFKTTANSGYDYASEMMDKFNNELGIYLFLKMDKVSDIQIIDEIKKQIIEGNARKISKDGKGRSVGKDFNIIEDSIWKKEWYNQRLLIQTNK
ncbi:MAG: hypothetical protein PHE13_02675 [Bacteroidales bacterium]|nr:hypothetical protein [Bacteroidales bacterium]